MTSNLELCEQFFAAITRGDIDAVAGFYAPNAVIWHNNDGIEMTPEQNLRALRWITKNMQDFRYEDVRRFDTGSGFVQQHTTCGTTASGAAFSIPACVIVQVVDGRITRLDEYLDSAQTAALTR